MAAVPKIQLLPSIGKDRTVRLSSRHWEQDPQFMGQLFRYNQLDHQLFSPNVDKETYRKSFEKQLAVSVPLVYPRPIRGKASVVDFQAELEEKRRQSRLQPPESSPDAIYERFNNDVHDTKALPQDVPKATMMKFIREYQTKVFKKTLMPEAVEVKPRNYSYLEEIYERIRQEMVQEKEHTHHHRTLREIIERIKRRRRGSDDMTSEDSSDRVHYSSTLGSTSKNPSKSYRYNIPLPSVSLPKLEDMHHLSERLSMPRGTKSVLLNKHEPVVDRSQFQNTKKAVKNLLGQCKTGIEMVTHEQLDTSLDK